MKSEWLEQREAENKVLQTDPPTQKLLPDPMWVNYESGTAVQWVCQCGAKSLDVFYEEGGYRTFARCPVCRFQTDIHTG